MRFACLEWRWCRASRRVFWFLAWTGQEAPPLPPIGRQEVRADRGRPDLERQVAFALAHEDVATAVDVWRHINRKRRRRRLPKLAFQEVKAAVEAMAQRGEVERHTLSAAEDVIYCPAV
jgi:hypothetical protein